jgi:hypothetical protein
MLVIFSDCCIHVLKLPDDGPNDVTETCSEIKIFLHTYFNTQQDAHYEDKRRVRCAFQRTGKAMGEMYQCWWGIC